MTQLDLARMLRGEKDRDPAPDPREVNHPLNRGHLLESGVIAAGARMVETWLIQHGESHDVRVIPIHLGGRTGRDFQVIHPTEAMDCHPDALYLVAPTPTMPRWRAIVGDAKTSNVVRDWDPALHEPPADVTAQAWHIWECIRAVWGSDDLSRVIADHLPAWAREPGCFYEAPATIEPIFAIPYALPTREPFGLKMLEIDQDQVATQVQWERYFLATFIRPWERGGACPWPEPEDLSDVQYLYPLVTPESEHVADEEVQDLLQKLQWWEAATESWALPDGTPTTEKERDAEKKRIKTEILSRTKTDALLVDAPGGRVLAQLKAIPESVRSFTVDARRDVGTSVIGINKAREKLRLKNG